MGLGLLLALPVPPLWCVMGGVGVPDMEPPPPPKWWWSRPEEEEEVLRWEERPPALSGPLRADEEEEAWLRPDVRPVEPRERPGEVEAPLRLKGEGLVGSGEDSSLILGLTVEEEEEEEEEEVTGREEEEEEVLRPELPPELPELLLLLPEVEAAAEETEEEEPCCACCCCCRHLARRFLNQTYEGEGEEGKKGRGGIKSWV